MSLNTAESGSFFINVSIVSCHVSVVASVVRSTLDLLRNIAAEQRAQIWPMVSAWPTSAIKELGSTKISWQAKHTPAGRTRRSFSMRPACSMREVCIGNLTSSLPLGVSTECPGLL